MDRIEHSPASLANLANISTISGNFYIPEGLVITLRVAHDHLALQELKKEDTRRNWAKLNKKRR